MAYVPPVSLPSAAGVDFGEGDVRHFSQGDSVTVPGLSNPTRHLAARDNLIAKTLNEVVAEVNNHEQIVPLPVYRLVIPPSSEEIVANHRIPVGYEARVLNAIIASTPTSADIELNVMWSVGFGNVSGETVMTTTSESSGGTTFSPAGEFIVQVKNKGNVTLDIVASVMLTMRPITDVSGALLPAATVAPPGPTGAKGDKGDKGNDGGAGPAGTPGLNFRRQWTRTPFPVTYLPNDVVNHNFAGTNPVSSFVCLQTNIADGINEPNPTLMPSPFWDFIAQGQAGTPGTAGPRGADGNAAVQFSNNSYNMLGTIGSPFFSQSGDPDYFGGGGGSPGDIFAVNPFVTEAIVSVGSHGSVALSGEIRTYISGNFQVSFPDRSLGATVDWTTDTASMIFVVQGTIPVRVYNDGVSPVGTVADSVIVRYPNKTTANISIPGNQPVRLVGYINGNDSF